FVSTDRKSEVAEVTFTDPTHRVLADARFLVGDQSLSCIKCHTFDKYKATGIQSLDMTTMTRRLRRDWFHRYLLNPSVYRPGTRMPSAWPNNKSVVPTILYGDPAQQIQAIWDYLSDGSKAAIPSGLIAEAIVLKPVDRPVIYRNFIDGLSPRGIAVGYPEKVHLAWDAEQMNVRLIWHGAFLDASMHWVGRGPGFQKPLGDHVMPLVSGQPIAHLASLSDPWPQQTSREAGFQFLGYTLDAAGRPTFRYVGNGFSASDTFLPIPHPERRDTSLQRRLLLTPQTNDATTADASANRSQTDAAWVRIVSGKSIREAGTEWVVDDAIRLQFTTGAPVLRRRENAFELLVPVTIVNGVAEIVYDITW
ncbi:MAG: hypothetical protein KDA89_10825, partial [Planctomycetaceae bacterium]|nr:hypothetical protein [Planctomycetaceae bacterium]